MTSCCPSVRERCSPMMRATTSLVPPGANGTTIVMGRVGYACAQATRERAGSAAAPARCRNLRRGSFIGVPLRGPALSLLLRSVEVPQIRRRLILLGGHQVAVRAQVI